MTRVDVPFERLVLDGIGRLLLEDQDVASAASALRQISERLPEVPAIAFKHKVTTVMYKNAQLLGQLTDAEVSATGARLVDLLEEDRGAALMHRKLLEQELARIVEILGHSPVVLKGFCNARFYPPRYVRWMRDIDLLCEDWDEALVLLDRLLELGYRYDEDESPWVKADLSRGRDLYGQIFLIRPEGGDFCRVDIHYGTYSVGYSGYLNIDLNQSSTTAEVGGRNVRVLKPGACILIAQSHALSDGYVAIKDVNDFVAMAISGEDLDWQAVGTALRQHRLTTQASLLARHVLSLYSEPRVISAAKALLEECGTPRWSLWQTHNRSWRLRAQVNASFAFRWHLSRGDRATRAACRAVQCYLFYIRRLQLSVRPRSRRERLLRRLMATPDLGLWHLRPDACALLIDAAVIQRLAADLSGQQDGKQGLAATVADGIEVLTRDGYQYIRVRGRTFVPTLDLIIPPGQAAALPGLTTRWP